jgi:hypothetical protein
MTLLPTLVAEPPKEMASGLSKLKTAPKLLQLFSSLGCKHQLFWQQHLLTNLKLAILTNFLNFKSTLNLRLQQNLLLTQHKMGFH